MGAVRDHSRSLGAGLIDVLPACALIGERPEIKQGLLDWNV